MPCSVILQSAVGRLVLKLYGHISFDKVLHNIIVIQIIYNTYFIICRMNFVPHLN